MQSMISLLLLSISGSQEEPIADVEAEQDTGAAWESVKDLLTHINETDQRAESEIADTQHPPSVSSTVCYSAQGQETQVYKRSPEGVWVATGDAVWGTVVEALRYNPDPLVRLMDPLCVLPCALMGENKPEIEPKYGLINIVSK